jgi:hypothetical protein
MTWNEVGQWLIDQPQTVISASFTSRIAIKVSAIPGVRPTWNWAGYFTQYLDIPLIGLARVDEKIDVSIKNPTLFIPKVFKPNYSLRFFRVDWIESLIITIFEAAMPLSFEPVVNIPSMVASTATSFTIPLSTTSVVLLAANASRKKLVVANNTNQDLYLDLDATAAVADHCVKIPKVTASGFIATYELEEYTGVVSGIWGATGAGAALIREMV